MGGVVLGHHQQDPGVHHDAVDYAGAELAAEAPHAAPSVPQQGVDQGAVWVAGRGMDHHPLGLVDHQQVPVLIDDVQK